MGESTEVVALQAEHDDLIQRMATRGYTSEDLRTSEQQLRQLERAADGRAKS